MKFTLYSNKFIVGEVLTKTELEEYAKIKYKPLKSLEDRIILDDDSKSCYKGKEGGVIYETFVKMAENEYKYLGELLLTAKVKKLELLPAYVFFTVKKEVKKYSANYIITINQNYDFNLNVEYNCIAEIEGNKNLDYNVINHLDGLNITIAYTKRMLYLNEENCLQKLIREKEQRVNFFRNRIKISDLVASTFLKENAILKYLREKKKEYEILNNIFLFG